MNFSLRFKKLLKGSYCPSPFKFDNEPDDFYSGFLPPTIPQLGTFTPSGILCPPGTYGDAENQDSSNACKENFNKRKSIIC